MGMIKNVFKSAGSVAGEVAGGVAEFAWDTTVTVAKGVVKVGGEIVEGVIDIADGMTDDNDKREND